MLILFEGWFCRIGVNQNFAGFTFAHIYPYFRCYDGKKSKPHSGKLNDCPIFASRLTPPIAHGTVATSRWMSYCESHKFQRSFDAALFYGITCPQPTKVWHSTGAYWSLGANPRYFSDPPFRAWTLGLDGLARHSNGSDVFATVAIVANAQCKPGMEEPGQLARDIGDHRL